MVNSQVIDDEAPALRRENRGRFETRYLPVLSLIYAVLGAIAILTGFISALVWVPQFYAWYNHSPLSLGSSWKESHPSIYDSLSLGRSNGERQIRLLRLDSHHSPISAQYECAMEVVSLEDNPRYLALSHTWGNGQFSESVVINGLEVPVTFNVKTALMQWSLHYRLSNVTHYAEAHKLPQNMPYYLWVDAICINQHDEMEKASQIQLMSEIYTRANATVAWLGPTSSQGDAAFTSFAKIRHFGAALAEYTRPSIDPLNLFALRRDLAPQCIRYSNYADNVSVGLNTTFDLPIQPLTAIFEDSWWRRVWTWQEAALANRILISWGLNTIDYQDLEHLALVLVVKWKDIKDAGKDSELESSMWYLFGKISNFSSELEWRRRNTGLHSLLESLSKIRRTRRQCSDPRDHFFGLLGMVDPDSPEMQELRDIRYSDGWVSIFIRVTQALIRVYGIDMLAFSFSAKRGFDSTAQELLDGPRDLPSWVPDPRTPQYVELQDPI
ncbi:uncharacterized protein KY384_004641 [Bacidia gigantensis]|uniref:uncharacterized protein n=1 Tax=Bacidia gigantensis TaxID=2732470 RepID=UPI001D050742|nr:uncharacterized protein KY384_004641 [Bacidia gigantensis]KAG8530603.1 hypothetical protein KY384_004641 [Bacidia gigantensis]